MNRTLRIAWFLLTVLAVQAQAQDRLVTGKVTSAEDGAVLPGVNITVKGTSQGTTTNGEGNYDLNIPTDATLVFSFIGLISQEIAVGNRTTIDVRMVPDVKSLGEIVVVGYGSQDKRLVTGSVASVNANEIRNVPIVSVDQALQGRAAGVQVTQNSGTPGSGIAVRVRGANSINASSEPLYVIDGVPINTGSSFTNGGYSGIAVGNQQTNALADLNPSDILSIEVLKDAAAAAIYGSRAG
ncbi:MAG: TonB-dependent receptor plug domain-containing protein, partial [Ferruginibacter sp.]|nr:TonB-dependent receptor plug domain-containing protein [Cytophagales bacterium]